MDKKRKLETQDDSLSKRLKLSSSTNIDLEWKEDELLSENLNIDLNTTKNIIKLFEEGNTVPFIARYRRFITNNKTAEELREFQKCYDDIKELKTRSKTILKTLEKNNVLNCNLRQSIINARSAEELEYVYAPYKSGSTKTLAERAKSLGLEKAALDLLESSKNLNFHSYIKKDVKGLSTLEEVETGIMHIIASIISSDTEVLTFLREIRKKANFTIKTKKVSSSKHKSKKNQEEKFVNYFNYENSVKNLKPHQILAINRGETLKILSVKIVVSNIFHEIFKFCQNKWKQFAVCHTKIFTKTLEDSYQRLIQPLIVREIRNEMKMQAEKIACETFSKNLKNLLLSQPVKGKKILGIDPGFANGCKMALISPTSDVISTCTIYPHPPKENIKQSTKILRNILIDNDCDLIALGNGTASRQTEEWITDLIESNTFKPLDVKYAIVDESGSSIYSCSPVAKDEFPDLDTNVISAVSLARRLQDPLSELIKIEPKHLGVGMYQHDLKKKHLDTALDAVISECVSFVGIDLNTASELILKHVAGLSDKRAKHIVSYRTKIGQFHSRKQLKDVSGIGDKIYEQCIGFLRVCLPDYSDPDTTKLDSTIIHPESYGIAMKVIEILGLNVNDLGESHFINGVESQINSISMEKLAKDCDCTKETIDLILEALRKPLNCDMRDEGSNVPLFKRSIVNIDDLEIGNILTGRIANVTTFGCFVDVGVGVNGLIHYKNYNNLSMENGEKVEVKVLNVDVGRRRIQLQALNKI